MSERCTGHCCRVFDLPFSLEEMQAKQGTIQDGEFIADMLVPLGKGKTFPGACPPQAGDEDRIRHFYTCKHFDGTDCTVYKVRPQMCQQYPYGRACTYEGCTHKPDVKVSDLLSKMKDKFPGVPAAIVNELLTPDVVAALEKEDLEETTSQPKPSAPKRHPLTIEQRLERIERRLAIVTDETE